MPGISLRPSLATDASKFTDLDIELQNCHFGEATYANGQATFALLCDWHDLETGNVISGQFFGLGSTESWSASDDGQEAIPTKDGGTLKKTCNFYQFLDSLVAAGFPEDKLTDRAECLEGLRVHIKPKAVRDESAKNGTRDVNIVDKILPNGLPWEASKRKKAGEKKAAASGGKPQTSSGGSVVKETPAPVAVDAEITGYALMVVNTVLENSGGEIERKKLMASAMKIIQHADNKEVYPAAVRGKIIAALGNDDVLGALDGIEYDGAVLKRSEK